MVCWSGGWPTVWAVDHTAHSKSRYTPHSRLSYRTRVVPTPSSSDEHAPPLLGQQWPHARPRNNPCVDVCVAPRLLRVLRLESCVAQGGASRVRAPQAAPLLPRRGQLRQGVHTGTATANHTAIQLLPKLILLVRRSVLFLFVPLMPVCACAWGVCLCV